MPSLMIFCYSHRERIWCQLGNKLIQHCFSVFHIFISNAGNRSCQLEGAAVAYALKSLCGYSDVTIRPLLEGT